MSFDVETLRAAVTQHGSVARVVVTQVRGSAPREVGAAMLVWAEGQSGTIGGGRLEWDAAALAHEVLRHGTAIVRRFTLGPDLGQCCGGAVQLLVERYDAASVPVTFPHIRPLGPQTPAPRLRPQMRTGVYDGWFAEVVHAANHAVWIYGAGHVGRALVACLAPLPDLAITWVDIATDRFPDDVPAGVTCLPVPDPARAVALSPRDAHHLILTHSHDIDLALCHAVLSHGFGSVGLIGSVTKRARFHSRLAGLGHPMAEIARISCPIGDPLLGRHPQAIALGVAASLISGLARDAHTPAAAMARKDA
jgi:xanthine dehydrogenase accessory factor